jgi:hypothetical protein
MLVKLFSIIIPTLLVLAVIFLSQNTFSQTLNTSGLQGVKKNFIDTLNQESLPTNAAKLSR